VTLYTSSNSVDQLENVWVERQSCHRTGVMRNYSLLVTLYGSIQYFSKDLIVRCDEVGSGSLVEGGPRKNVLL
jgi:hypothetical protein